MVFIVVEGIDAAGKHTHTKLLKEHFTNKSRPVLWFSPPDYETWTGRMIADYLAGRWSINISKENENEGLPFGYQDNPAYLFQCCQTVNRLECIPDELWDCGKHTKHVFIADRYNTSALAYGKAAGIDYTWLLKIHKPFPKPDVSIFLDISVEESFQRRPTRRDKYEQNIELLNKVRNCYREIFSDGSDKHVIIDAHASIEIVHERIMKVLLERGLLE